MRLAFSSKEGSMKKVKKSKPKERKTSLHVIFGNLVRTRQTNLGLTQEESCIEN
jgi:hypothetical protein